MVSPAERAISQPQPPSEKRKTLGGLRGRFATATLFVGGLSGVGVVAGAISPSPTEASGMLMTASAEGTNCVEDGNLLVTDLVYAAQLLEQIASGELVIAFGPALIAAANEGDETAATQPKTITLDEIWANLIIPAPECPPKVDPTPTPEATPSGPAPDSFEAVLASKINHKVTFEDVFDDIDALYATEGYKEALRRISSFQDSSIKINKKDIVSYLRECRDEKAVSDRIILCSGNIANLILYARQFPLGSGDPIDAAINAAWANEARDLRSAVVNDGVPAKRLDRQISGEAKFYDSF